MEYESSVDNPLNQALLGGLVLGSQTAADVDRRVSLRRMTKTFGPNVSHGRLDRTCMDRAWRVLDRRTSAYKPALTLIELLIESQPVSLEDTPGKLRFSGFVFDMNRFSEALLSRFLQEYLEGYAVKDEFRLNGMFSYDPAHNPLRHPDPVLRPDFIVLQGREVAAVLDDKYRDLSEREQTLPREMLYQLSLYALSQPEPKRQAVTLFPTMRPDVLEQIVRIQEPLYGASKAEAILRPVCLVELEQVHKMPATTPVMKKRSQKALYYALGK